MSLLESVSNQHISIMSDNRTAISYVNAKGGCTNRECNAIAKAIWLWAIKRHNWLSVAHQPGRFNVTADSLSRHFEDGIEWELNRGLFEKICGVFGVPQIDLFASRVNHQTSAYASWKPDPHASYVDAFSVSWSQFANSYIFPPFCLVGRCLQKLVLEQATAIIIEPLWTTQTWFTSLLSLLVDVPRLFRVTKKVLSHPVRGDAHPLSPKVHLLACKVSGASSLSATFWSETWDVKPVLEYLELLYPLDKLSLKQLTHKLAILLALTSGQRCQTLSFLRVDAMKKTPDYYLFYIRDHVKQDRPGNVLSSFFVRKYPKEPLCVYSTLEYYLERTQLVRDYDNGHLLLSYVKPYRHVGTSSIGGWVKTVLGASGVDTAKFKAHNTRSAAASRASRLIPTDEILKHIGWSRESTFQKFYNKPVIAGNSFAGAVLK